MPALPAAICASHAAGAPPDAPVIVVAEDDGGTLALLLNILRRKGGYTAHGAETGRQAIELVVRHRPALVLLDGNMPDLDGFEACQRLKAEPEFANLPVIFLTGLTDVADKVRGFDAGGSDYVTKPVQPRELLARIRVHLDAAARRNELAQRAAKFADQAAAQQARLDEVRTGQQILLGRPETALVMQTAVHFQPAHEAGGDFYDILPLSDDECALFIADVSGHDLSVPYITGALKALTAAFISEALTPTESLLLLNGALVRFLGGARYVSAALLRFSRSQMEVTLAVAGHPPALHLRADGTAAYADVTGDILGVFDPVQIGVQVLPVQPGERIFLYTDGLVEGFRTPTGAAGGLAWGLERLAAAAREQRRTPLDSAVGAVASQLLQERGGTADDDIVVLGVEF